MAHKYIIRKNKINKSGKCLIYCQYIKHDNAIKRKYTKVLISTEKKIEPKNWDTQQGKAKGKSAIAINKSLGAFEDKLNSVLASLEKSGEFPTPSNVKNAFKRELESNHIETGITESISHQWEEFIIRKEHNGLAPNSIKSHRNAKDSFLSFLGKKSYLSPSSISYGLIEDYQIQLLKKYKPNTSGKYLKRLKEFLRSYSIRGGKISFSLDLIKYKETPRPKLYLDELELESLGNLKLKGNKELYRDIFLLLSYTGLRISDLKNLDKNIINGQISLRTQKNNKEVTIPITREMDLILNKYDNVIPPIVEWKFNKSIKEICKLAIPNSTLQIRNDGRRLIQEPKFKHITIHDAIRTFIMLCHNKGISIKDISTLVGKSIAILEKNYIPEAKDVALESFRKAFNVAPMKVAK